MFSRTQSNLTFTDLLLIGTATTFLLKGGNGKYFKTIDMAVGKTPRWGVSSEKALEAIEKDGFYLTTGQIHLEEREG
jgi:hypothetical protein